DLRRELTERRDDAAYFRAVDCPVLLLWGREDSVVPLSVMRQLASRLPSVRRVCVLDHCGHSMFTECAGVSVRCVRSFLRSLH
ncbi:MAG: alpha/beta fold hydrolase, partial [Phycisphaerae bacterium]